MSAGIKKKSGGRWPKGVSGNPDGRPKGVSEIGALARTHAPAAIARLFELMYSKDEAIAVSAARALLDRGLGKPAMSITTDGAPLVSITMATGGQLIDAAQAAAAYAAICCDPSASMDGITFAAHASPTLDHRAATADEETPGDNTES